MPAEHGLVPTKVLDGVIGQLARVGKLCTQRFAATKLRAENGARFTTDHFAQEATGYASRKTVALRSDPWVRSEVGRVTRAAEDDSHLLRFDMLVGRALKA